MGWLSNTFQKEKVLEDLASIRAMHYYLQEVFLGNGGKHSIDDSIVELVSGGKHSSNGLLVTTNGYFLTAFHCIDGVSGLRLVHKGVDYPLERLCATSREDDLAFLKTRMGGEPVHLRHAAFAMPAKFPVPIALVMYNNQSSLERKYGWLNGSSESGYAKTGYGKTVRIKDHYAISAEVQKGNSGAPVVDPESRIVGLVSTGAVKTDYGTLIQFTKCLDLIAMYKQHLETKCK